MDNQAIERLIFKRAAEFPHPVLGVEVEGNHVFIFDQLQKDRQTPAHAIHYILDEDDDRIILRAPNENDPRPAGEEEDGEE